MKILVAVIGLLLGLFPLSAQTASTQILAYRTDEGIVLLDVERNVRSLPLPNSKYATYFRWSRDGRYLSYHGSDPISRQPYEFMVYDLETGISTLIEDSPAGFGGSFWSADGLTFYYVAEGNLFTFLWQAVASKTILTQGITSVWASSPDGRFIGLDKGTERFLLDTNHDELIPLQIDLNGIQWWDAAHLIYFVEDESAVTLYSYDVQDRMETALFEIQGVSMNSDYLTLLDGEIHFSVEDIATEVVQYTVWDGENLSIEDEPFHAPSPDGQYAVVGTNDTLNLLTRTTGTWEVIDEVFAGALLWSPSSDYLVYGSRHHATVYTLATGTRQTYTAQCVPDDCGFEISFYTCGDWSPDERWLICQISDLRGQFRHWYLVDVTGETMTDIPDALREYGEFFAWRPSQ